MLLGHNRREQSYGIYGGKGFFVTIHMLKGTVSFLLFIFCPVLSSIQVTPSV